MLLKLSFQHFFLNEVSLGIVCFGGFLFVLAKYKAHQFAHYARLPLKEICFAVHLALGLVMLYGLVLVLHFSIRTNQNRFQRSQSLVPLSCRQPDGCPRRFALRRMVSTSSPPPLSPSVPPPAQTDFACACRTEKPPIAARHL